MSIFYNITEKTLNKLNICDMIFQSCSFFSVCLYYFNQININIFFLSLACTVLTTYGLIMLIVLNKSFENKIFTILKYASATGLTFFVLYSVGGLFLLGFAFFICVFTKIGVSVIIDRFKPLIPIDVSLEINHRYCKYYK